jgi:predicted secreted hydrolase
MAVKIAGEEWRVEPLMDDQELDARGSTGTLYWEGLVRATGPNGATGRGYLELTGYAERLKF